MKKNLIPILILLLLALALNVAFYYIYFPGSTLDGNSVSWTKRPEAKVEPMPDRFSLVSEKLGIKEEIGSEGMFSHVYSLPKKELFTLRPLHQSFQNELHYDEDVLKSALEAAYAKLPTNQEGKNATLSLKNGEFQIQPSKHEIKIPDFDSLLALAKESIAKGNFTLSLDQYIQEPEVPTKKLRKEANKWKSYQLICPDYAWVLDGKAYLSLFNEDFSLNKEKATKVFKEYFKEQDTDRTMWIVQQEESLPIFLKALEEKARKWEPEYIRVQKSPDSNYRMSDGIAISIDRQWLWLYRGGEVVFQAPVITGNPNRGYSTHRGHWSILEMDRNTRLANTNREGYSYDVPVSYWMQINTMGMIEGIHDAAWHWAFGTDHYLYDGSHGCINLHPSDMATLYPQCWVGMPVWVY